MTEKEKKRKKKEKKRERERERQTPQNCKSPLQEQKFIKTIKSVTKYSHICIHP